MFYKIILVSTVLCFSFTAFSKPYSLNNNSKSKRIVGQEIYHTVTKGQSFADIGELYNTGILAMIEANPNIDPLLPRVGTKLVVPDEIILPNVYPLGIVVNLAELRLYYFPKDQPVVHIFPIGIGRHGLPTPNLRANISEKKVKPTWRPPEVLKQRHFQETGEQLADEIPPGPDNPLGSYALRIGKSEYLIHGTNVSKSIGLRVSSGCIRMREQDIAWLFEQVNEETKVNIVNQPIKMARGKHYQEKYIQAHQPLKEYQDQQVSLLPLPQPVEFFINQELTTALASYFSAPSGRVVKLDNLIE